MFVPRIRTVVLALAAGLSLSACVYDGDYGHSGISVRHGSFGYHDPYHDDYDFGYGYGRSRYHGRSPYYGWYDGYYYPGAGNYIYDQQRRPRRWNDRQQRYWVDQRRSYGGGADYREDRPELRQNWQEFRRERHADDRESHEELRPDRGAFQRGEINSVSAPTAAGTASIAARTAANIARTYVRTGASFAAKTAATAPTK